MGCNVREKHIRTNRRHRSSKPEIDHTNSAAEKTTIETNLGTWTNNNNYRTGLQDPTQNPNPNPDTNNSNLEDSSWGYCTEEQLEEILLKNLELIYNEAVSKIVGLGYDDDVALKAILRNGYFYGGMDVLTNILHNALTYLESECGDGGENVTNLDEFEPGFVDLKQLEEYSLAVIVCLLQQVKPHSSRGDAMWCLLMSDLHVGRASGMEIPVLRSSPSNNGCGNASVASNVDTTGNGPVGVSPTLCRFHGGWGFGNRSTSEIPMNRLFSHVSEMDLQREIEWPKRFNLTPSMKNLLKRNVAMFAAGFSANSKQLQAQSACPSSLSCGDSSAGTGNGIESAVEKNEESQNSKNQDVVNSMFSKFRDLNLDENVENAPVNQKDEMILSLVHRIKDLERQVKERKEWAQEKAMQAARKLSNDLTELKMLRMEREETQRLKKGKQTLEDTTMKRLSEMENALRKASGQVDRANAAVRKLETDNAEIRAEMEASKLSTSESVSTCLEAAKREKKCLKKLLAWEKQKAKLQEEIAAEKQKISEVRQRLVQVEAAQKEAEAKWRQEQKGKELALVKVEEENRLKETTEANSKRKHEALRLKIEIDFQRHKDDLQRLEQELSQLKSPPQSTALQHQSNNLSKKNSEGAKPQRETIAKMLHDLDELENSSEKETGCDRECIICKKYEVSVVFLPCAHQVLCGHCNDDYGKKRRAICPCCRVPIEQRIRVFGSSS